MLIATRNRMSHDSRARVLGCLRQLPVTAVCSRTKRVSLVVLRSAYVRRRRQRHRQSRRLRRRCSPVGTGAIVATRGAQSPTGAAAIDILWISQRCD